MNESPKNTEVVKEATDSEDYVKHIRSSCAFKNEIDHNLVVYPCYVKLERVNIPVKHHHEDLSENSSLSKKIKRQEYNKCLNRQDESTSNSDCLLNRKQSNDTTPDHRLSESSETFSEKILKPCCIRLPRWIDKESVSDVDHTISSSNDYQMNILSEEEGSISDSFMSADRMTSASSSVGTEIYRIESEETEHSKDHILNFYTKDRAKFSSSSSLELIIEEDGKSDGLISGCKTIKNSEDDCLKKRENILSKKRAKRRKSVPSKKGFNIETLVNSSSDSSTSTVFDSSISENNSSKLIGHGLKEKNVECDFSPVSFSGLTRRITARKSIKPVLCDQNRNSLDITNVNNNNSFTSKYESSCKSDTEQNLSDNYYTKYNSNTEGLKDNSFKHCSSVRRKHFMNTSKNFCKEESEKNFISTEEMSSSSSLLGSKLRNSESEKQVNELSNYTVKPCYVSLTRMKDIDALAKRIREKSNLVKENIHKHDSQLEFELNFNEQIESFKKINISEKNKGKTCTEENRKCIGENAVSVGDDCKVFTDPLNDCTSRCSNSITNSLDLLECSKESIHTASCSKSYKKCVPSSSDDSVSLPDIIEIVNTSKHLYESTRKFNFQSDDSIENDKRIENEDEICVVNESVRDIKNEGNESSSCGNSDRLSDRVRRRDDVTCTSKQLNKSSSRELSSESDDTFEKGKRIINNHENCVVIVRDINEVNESSSRGNTDKLSDRFRTRDKITSKRLNLSSAKKLNPEREKTVENGKRIVNDHETGEINVSDYKNHAARDIDNESNKSSSHGNSDRLPDRVRRRDNITCTFKNLSKDSAEKLSSESDDTVENDRKVINDHQTGAISVSDYKSHAARDINNEGNKSSSHGSSDRLSDKVRRNNITCTSKHLSKSFARQSSSESDDAFQNGRSIINNDGTCVVTVRDINALSNSSSRGNNENLSDRFGTRNKIICTSKHINKSSSKKLSSESDDTTESNNNHETGVISATDYKSHAARDNNEGNKSSSHGSSDRLSDKVRDNITCTSEHLNESFARESSSESDDTVENCKGNVNDSDILVTNESDDESNDAREINNNCNRSNSPGSSESSRLSSESDDTIESDKSVCNATSESDDDASDINIACSRSNSPGNSEINRFSDSGTSNDSDNDQAYFADSDDCTESDIVNLETCSVHDDLDENSIGLNVGPCGRKNENRSNSRIKIPYYCPKFENGYDSIFVFRSKTNGSVYIVDLFEYENIRKMFITIHLKERGNLFIKRRFIENELRITTDKINELGCYDKENERLFRGVPGFLRYMCGSKGKKRKGILEKEFPCLSPTSCFSDSKSNDDLSDSLNCTESSDSSYSQPGCSRNLTYPKKTNVCNYSNDDSDQCVHCSKKFANRKENYNHTCFGKLEKGFLCMYCEQIFPSYLKLVLHKKMHFM